MKARAWRLLALAVLLLGVAAQAEYLYSKEYTEAARAVLARRYSDARTLAESMLAQNAESFEAHTVLGQAYLWGDEDLGLAEYHLQQARTLVETRFTRLDDETAPRQVHQQVLKGLRQVAFLRENYGQALTLLDGYESLYEPLPAIRGWLLLKLGRYEEAKAVVMAAQDERSADDPEQAALWDILGQLAYEQNDSKSASLLFERAASLELEFAQEPDPVYLTNQGEALRDQGDFEQAQERFKEALDWPHPGSYAEPNKRLAYLYAGAGRFEEAFVRLESAIASRATLRPQVVAHTRASHLAGVSEVFLAFGDHKRARQAVERSLLFPYRLAMNSGSTEVLRAKRYLLYAGALQLEAEQAKEARATAGGQTRWKLAGQAWSASLRALWARSQATVLLARREGLEKALRPYGAGAMQTPWLLNELARALGQPVIDKVLSDVSQPAWQDYAEQLSHPSLAAWETLVKAQMMARRGGWAQALKLDPAVSRRLGLSIGLKVDGPEQVRDYLYGSPRFHEGKTLTLRVETDLSATLSDREGTVLAQVAPQSQPARLAEELHRTLFEGSTTWSANRLDKLLQEPNPGRVVSEKLVEWL